MLLRVICAHCGCLTEKEAGHINRARAVGMKIFCDRECMGLAKRKHKTKEQKVAEKREYDAAYRIKNSDELKARRHEYFKRTYDPTKAAEYRKTRMPLHIEYCRRPEYRQWKADYDRRLRAREYGAFAEPFMLLLDLEKEILSRVSRYEIGLVNGTINKTTQRKRAYGRLVSSQP